MSKMLEYPLITVVLDFRSLERPLSQVEAITEPVSAVFLFEVRFMYTTQAVIVAPPQMVIPSVEVS